MAGEWLIGTFVEGGDSESGHKGGNKAKRVRTTFTEEQLSVLQANFQLDSNPDGQDLERIAHVTGLSKRVTQVWFQNSRARQKKHLHTGKMKGQHGKSLPYVYDLRNVSSVIAIATAQFTSRRQWK